MYAWDDPDPAEHSLSLGAIIAASDEAAVDAASLIGPRCICGQPAPDEMQLCPRCARIAALERRTLGRELRRDFMRANTEPMAARSTARDLLWVAAVIAGGLLLVTLWGTSHGLSVGAAFGGR